MSDTFLHEGGVAVRTYAICAPSTTTTAQGRRERRWAASPQGLLPRRDVVRCGGVGEGGVCLGGDGGDGISMLVERPRSDGWIIEWESTARCQRLRGENKLTSSRSEFQSQEEFLDCVWFS
ncbi:hypothetical protein C8F04DRAFT_1189554 [Mycena alexandri]|uniref:Uncharacterized protein n=1 Tax=Mycena alexandri TaxID=1745969 RepID=A0AAD6WXW3_9AGAR|nr:hypothetical protein C8F04DRAFT_1189554 [Mycena alexandri]